MMVLRRQKKTREKWSLPQIDNLAISPLVKSEVRLHRRVSLRCKFTFAAFEAESQILMMGIRSRRIEPFDLHMSGRRVAPHAVALVLRGTVHVLKMDSVNFEWNSMNFTSLQILHWSERMIFSRLSFEYMLFWNEDQFSLETYLKLWETRSKSVGMCLPWRVPVCEVCYWSE